MAGPGRADYRIVISGTMPKWRQYFNRLAGGFMCVLFAGLGLISARIMLAAAARPDTAPIIVSLIFMAFTTAAIAGQFWFQRRIVCEFDYDGRALRFRTLGTPRTEVRPLADIAQVKE